MKVIKRNKTSIRVIFIACILFSLSGISYINGQNNDKPNVLFIAIDDLNDWTGFLGGHPDVKTPNLDKLAKSSVVFSKAYCSAPACNPSRAAVMSGIKPSTSGVYNNDQPWRESNILKDAVTIPQHFKANGYKVMGSGKIFHGRYPDAESWDYYWPSLTEQNPKDPRPDNRPINGIKNTRRFDWGPVNVKNEEMGDWKVTDWVIDEINKLHDKPFFLACGIYRPHLPWYVPQKYFDMYPLDGITLPEINKNDLDDIPKAGRKFVNKKDVTDQENVTNHNQWKQAIQGYLASVTFADECVGRVINALNKSKYKDNTVIVLWSDHGWHLGEKLHWRKFALWEEATRNILMISAKDVSINGSYCEAPVNLLDIYPTLIDLCDLPPKAELEGNSLMPLLKDPSIEREYPSLSTYQRNNHTLRSDRWRYIRYSDGSEELYDHKNDEMEWYNLADKAEYKSIKEKLKKWLPKVNAENSLIVKD